MTRITNVNQVMLLLQSQLQSKKKAGKKRPHGSVAKKEVQQSPLSLVKSVIQEEDLPEKDIHRALIRGLLTEEFGASVANDPAFHSIIEDVLEMIHNDENSKRILHQAMNQLRIQTD